ncbi:flavin reductase family protein [Nocardioides terrisoli]|uniref:flavin reductase family protein n=1 Tax=Nocardioides terrisoli TaxID=3388267 RepID=UPI00287B97C9|nr:flavin reductase family protein [Nocardioides marmorisolisilvae]
MTQGVLMASLDPVVSGDHLRDQSKLRQLYGRYPTGVAAVCALRDGEPVGIVATSFTSVSLEPAIVSICVQHTSQTWPMLSADGGRIGVSVLASTHQDVCLQIAGRREERFTGVPWFAGNSTSVFLSDAAAWLDCAISRSIKAGDHDVVLLEVRSAAVNEAVAPLVFHDSHFHTLTAR